MKPESTKKNETAWPMLDDRLTAGNRATLAHIDRPLQHKHQAGRQFARLHDQGAGGKVMDIAKTFQARDIVIVQMREHLMAARLKKAR